MRDINLGLNDPGSAITRQDANQAGGYAGLDEDAKIDNRLLRRPNGYVLSKSVISIPHNTQLNFDGGNFTVEIIFNVFSVNTGDIAFLIMKSPGAYARWGMYLSGQSLIFLLRGETTNYDVVIPSTIEFGRDYHIIITYCNGYASIYLDGKLAGQKPVPSDIFVDNTADIKINSNGSYTGTVSLCRIYNRGFTQSDVDYYYNNGQPDKARLMYCDTNLNTDELIEGGNFESVLIGEKQDGEGVLSAWGLNAENPISGAADGRLIITEGWNTSRPLVVFPMQNSCKGGRKYRVSFDYKINQGFLCELRYYNGAREAITVQNTDITADHVSFVMDIKAQTSLYLYFPTQEGNLLDIQIDNLSVKEIGCVLELLPENATSSTWLGTQQGIDGVSVGRPELNYGSFFKKIEEPEEISYLLFRKTGDGSGTTKLVITPSKSQMISIKGGEFVNDDKSSTDSLQLLCESSNTVFVKTNRTAEVKVANIDDISFELGVNGPLCVSNMRNISVKKRFLANSSSNNIICELRDLSRSLTNIQLGGKPTIMGDILDIPRECENLILSSNNNTTSGVFANLPLPLKALTIEYGASTIGGDIADIPSKCSYIYVAKTAAGGSAYSYTQGHVFPTLFNTLFIRPYAAGELTATMIDNMLIDLAAQVQTAVGGKRIDLRGNCGSRTSASDAAVSDLQNLGFSVLTN